MEAVYTMTDFIIFAIIIAIKIFYAIRQLNKARTIAEIRMMSKLDISVPLEASDARHVFCCDGNGLSMLQSVSMDKIAIVICHFMLKIYLFDFKQEL